MFTSCLAEITHIKNRILSVKPLGLMAGITPPEIHDVPLGMLGNENNYTDHNLVVGDVILLVFLTFNPGNYVSFGGKNTLSDLNFNDYNNAVALPIVFNREVFNLPLPTSISHFGNVKHTGNTNREGDLTQNGNTTQTGNTEQTGSVTVTETVQAKLVNATQNATFGGISGKDHTHTVPTPEHKAGEEQSSGPN